MQPIEGKGGMQEITHQALSCGSVAGLDRLAPEDGPMPVPQPELKRVSSGGDIRREVEALLVKMNSSDASTRELLLEQIVLLGPTATEPLIISLRQHPDKKIRLMAAIALGKNRDLRAISLLGHAAKGQDPEIAAAARASMKELQSNRLAIEAESARRKKTAEQEKMLQDIQKTATWRLQHNYLSFILHSEGDPRRVEEQNAREAELKARGVMTLPADARSPEAVGEAAIVP